MKVATKSSQYGREADSSCQRENILLLTIISGTKPNKWALTSYTIFSLEDPQRIYF
jgi:hypothetical protein